MIASKERDRAATEERLKSAAMAIWSQHGFDGASVKEIADAAGANVSLINRYFGGKQGLLIRLVDEMIIRKQEGELDYPPQNSLEAEVRAYLQFRYRADMAEERLVRIIVSKIVVDRAFRDRALQSLTYAADANLLMRLQDLRDRGCLRADADLSMLVRQIGFVSFSASLTEGIILALEPDQTDEALQEAAKMIAGRYAAP